MSSQLRRLYHPEVAAQPWQEASSLIIASKTTPQQLVGNGIGSSITAMKTISEQEERCDYHILMVKRSSLSSFMANAFVFPGGLVEEADFSSAWWNVFEKAGASKDSLLQKFCNVKGPRPFMLRNPLLLSSLSVSRDQCIPADLAFRIAAIRETFEETGVLIGRYNMDDTKPTATSFTKDKVEIAQWKQKLKKNPFSFIDLCLECKICPDLWSLYEWSSWLTPTFFGHKRFDTMFYICFIEKLPEIMLDESEVVTFISYSPVKMLQEFYSSNIFLAPPQLYELSRLLRLDSFKDLKNFAIERGDKGVEHWLPLICTASNGVVSLMPGDDLYPENPDYYGQNPQIDFQYTLEELKAKSNNLHRMEVKGPISTVICNISSPCGHLTPLTYCSTKRNTQSSL
ncbi:acyl-coenzyme A diphosphatase NUDT19-like isoform X2 [Tachypleus tridentatus]|uniref:acyl-coenzyme A diphosphatase NUDT19-like isoform X2 n=1 Tax=Tachypleus tridentatus TaxID=6853 RepID=UPI003FD221D5